MRLPFWTSTLAVRTTHQRGELRVRDEMKVLGGRCARWRRRPTRAAATAITVISERLVDVTAGHQFGRFACSSSRDTDDASPPPSASLCSAWNTQGDLGATLDGASLDTATLGDPPPMPSGVGAHEHEDAEDLRRTPTRVLLGEGRVSYAARTSCAPNTFLNTKRTQQHREPSRWPMGREPVEEPARRRPDRAAQRSVRGRGGARRQLPPWSSHRSSGSCLRRGGAAPAGTVSGRSRRTNRSRAKGSWTGTVPYPPAAAPARSRMKLASPPRGPSTREGACLRAAGAGTLGCVPRRRRSS